MKNVVPIAGLATLMAGCSCLSFLRCVPPTGRAADSAALLVIAGVCAGIFSLYWAARRIPARAASRTANVMMRRDHEGRGFGRRRASAE